MTELIIFAIVNLVLTILSGASGGGGALVSTPLLILLGLTPAQAIATMKFSGFGISVGASSRFYKEKITDKRTVIIFSLISAVGALAGSLLLVQLQNNTELLEKFLGFVILFVGIPTLYFKRIGLKAERRARWVRSIGAVLLLLVVMLQAALSDGVGSLNMIILMSMFGMTALIASATRRAMGLTISTVSLAVFMMAGLVDYRFGMVALITSLIGGYIGAHIAIKKGDKFVINLFAVTSAMMALSLLLS